MFAALCAAGGVGAAIRFWTDSVVRSRCGGRMPWGTALINLSGSLLLGLLTGLVAAALVTADWRAILGTGLLGGYTTFSTATFETVRLLQQERRAAAAATGIGQLMLAILLSWAGFAIGSSW
ncbi:MAG: CrcB family protein [Nakamurella sp.]